MRKLCFTLIVLVIIYTMVFADTTEEKRINELNRKSLISTEKNFQRKENAPVSFLPRADMLYLLELPQKKVTYRYDICKVIITMLGVENEYIDLGAQIKFLGEKGVIPRHYFKNKEFDAMQPLRKGLAAYMFYQTLEIKGGLILKLFGTNERYALKELVHEGIMSPGSTNDIVTGEELLMLVTRGGEYLSQKTAKNVEIKEK